jgi:hypothetical protein
VLQPKLEVSSPGDAFEDEANAVAESIEDEGEVDLPGEAGVVAGGMGDGDDEEPTAPVSVMRLSCTADAAPVVPSGTSVARRIGDSATGAPLSGGYVMTWSAAWAGTSPPYASTLGPRPTVLRRRSARSRLP